MRIRILPEAERDLDLGAVFYESQSPGAGSFFIRGLLEDIDRLVRHGGVHAKHRGFFRAMSRRFPFGNIGKQREVKTGEHAGVTVGDCCGLAGTIDAKP